MGPATADAAVERAGCRETLPEGALAHVRPREGWIPVVARIIHRGADDGDVHARLVDDAAGVGRAGDVIRAERSSVAEYFPVGSVVTAFDARGVAETGSGRVRSVDTTTWPPTCGVEFEGVEGRVWLPASRLALTAEVEAVVEARAIAVATAAADAHARALLEEEAKEAAVRLRAASKGKEGKKKPKKKKSTSDGTGASESDATAADDVAAAEAAAENARIAAKAKARAEARARQEEIKAAKAAAEKAAKREAQKARKAAERAAREALEAEKRSNGDAMDDAQMPEETTMSPETETLECVSEEKDAVDPSPAPIEPPTIEESTLTETQRRKLAKERKKAQRMAEIDALLTTYEVEATDATDSEHSASGRTRKKKSKKKTSGFVAAIGSPVAATPNAKRVHSAEWFSAFVVIAFFAVLTLAYHAFIFARSRFGYVDARLK
ncbi:unnamed product [Ostreococcus tauri]|uniref:Unnamed product n=1 Tax=Ostreococcus tauri TaxID=70448 RepID=A0A096P8G1_OSTTA|nr:unnamed product [Ostreococcus tauri]CEG00189.1 unnamed product [Ostreococcus tauri]|eukprot:XP_022840241.1 unnamed product [Ostreococcus tauri]